MPESATFRWTHPAAILVATDLNDLDRLMPFALEQAEQTGARLILLHVLATGAALSADAVGLPSYDTAGIMEMARKAMLPWCEAARRRGVPCDALLREGHATSQIVAAARQFQADRILLGTRSRGKLGKMLLGSVAEQVLRSVNLPVVTVGPEAHLPVEDSGEQRFVLHATSLRETSRPSAALACRIAASQNARLVLLHILPPIDEMERKGLSTGLDSAAMCELRLLAAAVGEDCQAVEPLVIHGNPAIEILAAAAARHVRLIVLGATSGSIFQNLVRSRTVYSVLAHARCPVFTLRVSTATAAETPAESVASMQR
jgi:nucleotide-binding universal stress UspA family protein